jgi:acyl-coenzyme A synthetase/AMP-(fatty) acid ligase
VRDLVLAHGESRTDTVALYAPGRRPLTYGELAAQVRRAGTALRALALTPRDRVAIVLPNGPELAAAFVAVAAYAQSAPLNPAYQPPELDYFLGDMAAKALVVPAGSDTQAAQVARTRGIQVISWWPTSTRRPAASRCAASPRCGASPYRPTSRRWLTTRDARMTWE